MLEMEYRKHTKTYFLAFHENILRIILVEWGQMWIFKYVYTENELV